MSISKKLNFKVWMISSYKIRISKMILLCLHNFRKPLGLIKALSMNEDSLMSKNETRY
jgi:hypothetical protein